jgi:hypothetical protein
MADQPVTYRLDAISDAAVTRSVTAEPGHAVGRAALRVSLISEIASHGRMGVDYGDQPTFVVIPAEFETGTIDVDLLSRLTPEAPELSRGFAGLAYHLTEGGNRFESVYLRPTNGWRNHPPGPRGRRAVQYFAYPDWPYDRLREEYPDGRYESGADIALDEWIHLRLDVEPTRVTASVNGSTVLVVDEVKSAPVRGDLGLFVDIGTEAFFTDLTVTAV